MATQPPLLLYDNIFDTIGLYPLATMTVTTTGGEQVGWEARRVADYRREKSGWKPQTDSPGAGAAHLIVIDLGAGVTQNVDYLWLDRGHNLWGRQIRIEGDTTVGFGAPVGTTWTLPALGANIGTDPTTGWCETEEGSLYRLFAGLGAYRYWRFHAGYVAGVIPLFTGIMAGKRTQFLGYSAIADDDARARKVRTEESDAGWLASGPVYQHRTLELDMKLIGDTEYDGTLAQLATAIFGRGQPVFACLNYGLRPERAWLFQYDGATWGFSKTGAYRSGRIRLRECGPKLPR